MCGYSWMYAVVAFQKQFLQGEIVWIETYLCVSMFLFHCLPNMQKLITSSFYSHMKEIAKITTTCHIVVDHLLSGCVGDVMNQSLSYRGDGCGDWTIRSSSQAVEGSVGAGRCGDRERDFIVWKELVVLRFAFMDVKVDGKTPLQRYLMDGTVHNLMWLHGNPARHYCVKPLLNETQKVTFNIACMEKCDSTYSMTLPFLFSTCLSRSRLVGCV